jgi:hypothetical protein
MKVLQVERPGKPVEEHPLNKETRKKFGLDEADIEHMLEGFTIFRGDVAFSIEEEEVA